MIIDYNVQFWRSSNQKTKLAFQIDSYLNFKIAPNKVLLQKRCLKFIYILFIVVTKYYNLVHFSSLVLFFALHNFSK